MATLHITKSDLDADNFYIGATDVTDWSGDIEIAADLGQVKFKLSARAAGSIRALAGTGISAGWSISAGDGISAGRGISAGEGISAGLQISAKFLTARLRIFAGICRYRIPAPEEMEIHAEVREGMVAFGTVVVPTNAVAA
jgi:hypothetical protein